MNELGAAAGRTFAEVALFKKQYFVTTRGRVHSAANARGTPADDNHVPRLCTVENTMQHFLTIHDCSSTSHRFERDNASVNLLRSDSA
jgi:hypothetical protein